MSDPALFVELLHLLVDVSLEGLLHEAVVEVLRQGLLLVPLLVVLDQRQCAAYGTLLQLSRVLTELRRCQALLGRVLLVRALSRSCRVELHVLCFLGLGEVALEFLDIALPGLHRHLFLLLLQLPLLELLLCVDVLLQESSTMTLQHDERLVSLRHGLLGRASRSSSWVAHLVAIVL